MESKKINIVLVLLLANLVLSFGIYQSQKEKIVELGGKIDQVTVDTSGKIQNLNTNLNKLITDNKATTSKTEVIEYTPKTSVNDSDIELKTEPAKVRVSVNNGPKYEFELLPDEKTKFESGKLVVNSMYQTDLRITAKEYKRSRWSGMVGINADKENVYGVGYDFSRNLSAVLLAGEGIDPYIGIQFRIGEFN